MPLSQLSAPTTSGQDAYLAGDAQVGAVDRACDLLERQPHSRRAFMRVSAALGGAAVGTQLLGGAALAARRTSAPRAIPGGFELDGRTFHVFGVEVGNLQSTIRDFNGVIGTALIEGTCRGNDGRDYNYQVDQRFMEGVYIAENGKRYNRAFGFI